MWRYLFKKKCAPIQAASGSSTIVLQHIGKTCSVPKSIKMAIRLTNATTLSPKKDLQIIKAVNLKQISIYVFLLNANLQWLYARVYISQKNSITGISERGSLICGQSSFHSTSTVTNVLIQLRLPPSGSPLAVKREIRSSSQIPYLELTHFNT